MVEHPVQHHFDPVAVEALADSGEVLIGAQTAVDPAVVPGVVAVAVALKDGAEIHGVRPQAADVLRPVPDFADAAGRDAVVLPGGPAEAQGIDLIEYAFVCPHIKTLPFRRDADKDSIPQIVPRVEEIGKISGLSAGF